MFQGMTYKVKRFTIENPNNPSQKFFPIFALNFWYLRILVDFNIFNLGRFHILHLEYKR